MRSGGRLCTVRRMADPGFRAEQWAGRYAPHVEPLNRLVDDLIGYEDRGWLPYVAPVHGGAQARVLSVLRDPGPRTLVEGGSGMLCTENDDPTAETQARLFDGAGIAPADVTPWNAYPWYVNRAPTAAELQAGVEPLVRVVERMPALRVVLLQGRHAQAGWRRLRRAHPGLEGERELAVVATFHPGRQALWSPDPAVRAARAGHRQSACAEVARLLREG